MTAIDFAAWQQRGRPRADVLGQLQHIAALQRSTRAAASAGVTGGAYQVAGTDYAGIERSRAASLAEIEQAINTGRFDESLSAVDYLYALNLLYNPASLLAEAAEIETRTFLNMLAGGRLLDLTAAKGVHQEGPDGLFVGGIPALGIPSWGGLEVKTAVSTGSLASNIGSTIRAMGTEDYAVWRRISHGLAIARLREQRHFDIADQLAIAGESAFSTMLVVRASSTEDVEIKPASVYKVFNLVLRFDLFGYPIWDKSLEHIPGWAFDDLYAFAGNYNVEKAKASLGHYVAFL